MKSFVSTSPPMRVVFGCATIRHLADEAETLRIKRALVLSTPQQTAQAQIACDALESRAVATFSGAVMHTPVEVTEAALCRVNPSCCLQARARRAATGRAMGTRREAARDRDWQGGWSRSLQARLGTNFEFRLSKFAAALIQVVAYRRARGAPPPEETRRLLPITLAKPHLLRVRIPKERLRVSNWIVQRLYDYAVSKTVERAGLENLNRTISGVSA